MPTALLSDLEAEWGELKKSYGLPVDFPLKWAPDEESLSKPKSQGLDVSHVRRRVCEWLSKRNDIVVLAMVHQERRPASCQPGKGSVRDFYAVGVAFAVQRFASLVNTNNVSQRPHIVILDNIAWSRRRRSPLLKTRLGQLLARLEWGRQRYSIVPWMEEGYKALLQQYHQWLTEGFPKWGISPLGQMGFASSFVEAHGHWLGVLQLADFICGCAAELFSSVASDRPSPVAVDCVRSLMPVFCQVRGVGSGVWGSGIVLYPPHTELWQRVRGLFT